MAAAAADCGSLGRVSRRTSRDIGDNTGVDGPRKRLLFAPRLDRVPPKLQKLSLQATKSYEPRLGNPDVYSLVGRHRGMCKPS